MLGRKHTKQPEQGRGRQPRQSAVRSGSPAFSYYSNRQPETAVRRQDAVRQQRNDPAAGRSVRRRPRLSLMQLPFWLLVAVAFVCAIKLLALNTNPKVVLIGQTSATRVYAREAAAYSKAAHTLLSASLTSRTKLTVNIPGTAAALKKQFPELEDVAITLPLAGNRPIVYAQVAQPSAVLQTAAGNFALNANGLVLARLQTVPAGVPIVVDQSMPSVVVGKQVLPGSTIAFIQTVAMQLSAAHLEASAFILPSSMPYELDVRVADKPYIIKFNLQADARQQSGAAIASINQLGTLIPANYLDVRVPERVYYK